MKLLKNKIIFVVSLILATVFIVLSVIGFLWNSLTTQSDLPVDGVVTVSFDGSVRYVTTDGEKLLSLSEDGEILWQTDISDRVKDVQKSLLFSRILPFAQLTCSERRGKRKSR